MAVAAALLAPSHAAAAARQVWPAFVLVAGLLLVGLVAADDGLFEAAGTRLARAAPHGTTLFWGSAALVVLVTAVLNLDTAVVFVTPVLVHTARRRGERGTALLCGCILLSNAGSLLLPGSNLTNLIVLGSGRLSGSAFVVRMALPWVVATVVTATVVAVGRRKELARRVTVDAEGPRPVLGVGLLAVVASAAAILALRSPAVPVAAIGAVVVAARLLSGRLRITPVREALGLPVLVGLFGVAVALGTVGRAWHAPAHLFAHLDAWSTGGLAAVVAVAINNLPAASLLSAVAPAHPYALLVGLNLGPNLFLTGSLAWFLWLRSARAAGADPDLPTTIKLGVVAAVLSIPAALAALLVSVRT